MDINILYFTIEIAQQKVSANKPGLANKVFETKLISAVVWGNRLDSFLGAQMSQNMAANITIWLIINNIEYILLNNI